MALVACPECGQTISSDASMCVHCGRPIDPRRTKVDYITGETLGLQPRAAAHAARRPLRYPTNTGVALMAGGSAFVLLGSLMPWVKGASSVSGLETDGRYTLVLGGLMLILSLASRSSYSAFPRLLVMFGAAVSLIIGIIDNSRLMVLPGDLVAGGLRAVLIGGAAALVGSLLRSR